MIVERIATFVRGESDEGFEELALGAFRFQYEQSSPFRALCEERGLTPERVSDWREVPVMPVAALEGSEPAEPSSVTDLKRSVIDHSFPPGCLEGMERHPPVLALIPSGEEAADSELSFLAEHVVRAWAAPDSATAWARRGVEAAKVRSFLAARQRDRRPTLVLATSATLAQLLESLERRGLRFRLPPGSRVVAAGGHGPGSRKLLARLAEDLAVPAEAVVHAYGANGLTSRFYADHDRLGEPRPFRPPPWARVRILDPETLTEAPTGSAGPISVFDLASLGSAAHLLTGDVGVAGEEGFRLEPIRSR